MKKPLKKGSKEELLHRNQWFWSFLSGSDDLDWAALALMDALALSPGSHEYMSYSGPNFEKGVEQLMTQVREVYTDANGTVFWGLTPERYYAAISLNLDVLVHLRMYEVTRNKTFLDLA